MKLQVTPACISLVLMGTLISIGAQYDLVRFTPAIMLQKLPVSGPIPAPVPIRIPKPLPEEQKNQTVLLVHVGKAGGSSVRKLATGGTNMCNRLSRKAANNSTILNDEEKTTMTLFCSLGRVTGVVAEVAHMWVNQRSKKYETYSQYLVPVRNPVDRLISWYKYERHLIAKGEMNPKRAPTLVDLGEKCSFEDANSLIMNGLMDVASTSNSSSSSLMNSTKQGESSNPGRNQTSTFCRQLAKDCLTGEKACYAHNYYNYELYLEDLIRWRGECVETSHDACNGTVAENRRDIRIDVLRTEHVESDWRRILELWTGETNLTAAPAVEKLLGRKENSAESRKVVGSSFVPQEGIERLCRSICIELVAYKKAIAMADNLLDEEVEESYRELDERCGLSVDETCGTEFHYRNVKSSKRISSRRLLR